MDHRQGKLDRGWRRLDRGGKEGGKTFRRPLAQRPPESAVVECEFQFDGSNNFIIGCDGKKHIGRLVITPKVRAI